MTTIPTAPPEVRSRYHLPTFLNPRYASLKFTYHDAPDFPSSVFREDTIEYGFIGSRRYGAYHFVNNNAPLFAGESELRLLA
jgi:hypothetical protein